MGGGGVKGKQRTNLEALASGQAGREGRSLSIAVSLRICRFLFFILVTSFSLPNLLPDMVGHIESLSPEHVDGPFLCV